MFHVTPAAHDRVLGVLYAQHLKDALGESMEWTAPMLFWADLEPVDNWFDWTELDDFFIENSGVYRVLNLGPQLVPIGGNDYAIAGDVPGWIDNRYSNEELWTQYGELVANIVARYRGVVDMWWVGHETNAGGDGLPWEEWKDLLWWQVDLVRTVDAGADIAVSLVSWTDYNWALPIGAVHEIDGALELEYTGVDYDVIAIEYRYGTIQDGDVDDLARAISDLETVGRPLFIGGIFYPASTDPAHDEEDWGWYEAPFSGYSELWQADMWEETLELLYADPSIVGLNAVHFQDITYAYIDPSSPEAGWRTHAGILESDGTPKEAYFRLRDSWALLTGR